VSAEPGLLFYVMVDDLDASLDAVSAAGGTVVQRCGPDDHERIARFRDPAGNIVGLYQEPNAEE
jgi:hypothetical protein